MTSARSCSVFRPGKRHLVARNQFLGIGEIGVEGCDIPNDARLLHGRRIAVAGLGPALRPTIPPAMARAGSCRARSNGKPGTCGTPAGPRPRRRQSSLVPSLGVEPARQSQPVRASQRLYDHGVEPLAGSPAEIRLPQTERRPPAEDVCEAYRTTASRGSQTVSGGYPMILLAGSQLMPSKGRRRSRKSQCPRCTIHELNARTIPTPFNSVTSWSLQMAIPLNYGLIVMH